MPGGPVSFSTLLVMLPTLWWLFSIAFLYIGWEAPRWLMQFRAHKILHARTCPACGREVV